MKWQLLLLIK
ncbi:hypothetical protein RDI58_017732 [Solanum bulbocastanum]|uniref:Uncharacterized protein n=1 Tax=Solanum bulbocastanum TaxID=147425 RepID=A0AAN8T9A5_SOLBU